MRRVLATIAIALTLAGCAVLFPPEIANRAVPEPRKTVDLQRYLGVWYEQARFDHNFERGCSDVSATYALRADGKINVLNSCRRDGEIKTIEGDAVPAGPNSDAKLKVSFFGPFSADYWILDHAEDYSWAVVGEPSGRYLWILTRDKTISAARFEELTAVARALGYDLGGLIRVSQQP